MFFNYLFILLSFLIILITGQNIFGGCGIRPPIQLPLPCPPPIIPIPCPPPSPCPPTFCPPPIVCPPPLPPLPCPPPLPPPPPCPLPLPCTCPPQQIGGIISPIGGGYPIGGYPSNDCCCQCNTPCRYMRRVKTHGSQIFAAPNEDQTEEDSTCNSIKLKKAIQENIINDDPNISKREIQKVAEKKLFTKINVICAKGEFSYLAYTDTFCQASYGNITCYAYRSLGLESNNNNNNKEIIKTTTTLNDIDLI